MPNFCIFQDKIITPKDIYKFNINKNSEFICYNCNKRLYFRQSRNGDNNYTEHFYHQNNVKDTHINCENVNYQSVKKKLSEFHSMFSNFVKDDCKEIVRKITRKSNKTPISALWITHRLEELTFCDAAAIMEQGRLGQWFSGEQVMKKFI